MQQRTKQKIFIVRYFKFSSLENSPWLIKRQLEIPKQLKTVKTIAGYQKPSIVVEELSGMCICVCLF